MSIFFYNEYFLSNENIIYYYSYSKTKVKFIFYKDVQEVEVLVRRRGIDLGAGGAQQPTRRDMCVLWEADHTSHNTVVRWTGLEASLVFFFKLHQC